MKTKHFIKLSAAVSSSIAAYHQAYGIAITFLCFHILLYMLHMIEFKINKLLDHYCIDVSEKDLD